MKKNPKVSIIIPVYNGKDFMKEAIDSALAQTYDNIEILVVNDGSNDNNATRNIALEYGDKIKYFEKNNGGVSTALNLALTKMSGDYFSWLSHDDRYYPNKISDQIDLLKNYDDFTILYSDYDLMDENSNIFAKSIKDHEELVSKPEYGLLRGSINGITLLIPKKAFEVCGNFREDLRCTQDYELWYRMMQKFKFVHQPGILATTRLHKNQTGNTSPKVLKENNELWIDLIEGFSDKTKIKLENSVYNYYYQMREFIKTTNFDGTLRYLDDKISTMDDDFKKKSEDMLVSVVIPFYNNLNELKRAVSSVLNQTHKKFEILIIDDCSNCRIPKNEFNFDNIKIFYNNKNMGPSYSRNVGIKNSNGDFIAFLDSDDEFLPNKLENELLFLLKNCADFCFTSYVRRTSIDTNIDCNCDFKFIKLKCISNCVIATPTVMINKKILLDNSILYNEDIKFGEDVIFYLNIFKYTNPVFLNEYLTIVYSESDSAYIDINKQIEGTKNILRFLLNDNYYKKYNNDIAKLCYGLYSLVSPNINEYNVPVSPGPNSSNNESVNISKLKKIYITLKNKGFAYCLKRFCKKIVGK